MSDLTLVDPKGWDCDLHSVRNDTHLVAKVGPNIPHRLGVRGVCWSVSAPQPPLVRILALDDARGSDALRGIDGRGAYSLRRSRDF